jgi:hypothetical protein
MSLEVLQIQKELEERRTNAGVSIDTQAILDEFEDRLYASEQRNSNAAVYLEEMINAQRDRIDQLKTLQAEFVERMSKEFAGFMRTLAAPE